MKFHELQKLDKILRDKGMAGVYGTWDDNNKFFSLGEDEDNINVYIGNTPITEDDPSMIAFKGSGNENKDFDFIYLKNNLYTSTNSDDTVLIDDIREFLCKLK